MYNLHNGFSQHIDCDEVKKDKINADNAMYLSLTCLIYTMDSLDTQKDKINADNEISLSQTCLINTLDSLDTLTAIKLQKTR